MAWWDPILRFFGIGRRNRENAVGADQRSFDQVIADILRDAGDSPDRNANGLLPIIRIERDAGRKRAMLESACTQLIAARRPNFVKVITDDLLTIEEEIIIDIADAEEKKRKRASLLQDVLGPLCLRCRIEALVACDQALEAERTARLFEAQYANDPSAPEVAGLLTRVYFQRWLDYAAAGADLPSALQEAMDVCARGFARTGRKSLPLGLDLMAIAKRAQACGLSTGENRVDELAVLVTALADDAANAIDPRRYLLAAEAAAGAGAWQDAQRLLDMHRNTPESAALGAAPLRTLRQRLREIWEIDENDQAARGFITSLGDAANANVVSDAGLDLRLGGPRSDPKRAQRFDWAELLRARGRAVAQVIDQRGKGIGTGFLARGGDFNPAWKNRAVFVTNHHVVNRTGGAAAWGSLIRSIEYTRGAAHFTHSDTPAPIPFDEILWSSVAEAHDITILSLKELPRGVTPIPVRARAVEDVRAVTVLGHADGGALCFGNELLTALTGERDPLRDDRYLHYLTTTAGGCSGAPVLDWFDLSVIAVHHRGNIEPPAPTSRNRRRRGRNEPQSAAQAFNEGVRVAAIIAAIQRFPSGETEAQPEARVDSRPS